MYPPPFFFSLCFPHFDPDNCFLHASRFSCPVTQHANSSFDWMATAPPKASFKARCSIAQFVSLQQMPETFTHPVCLPTLQVALCTPFGSYFFTFLIYIYIERMLNKVRIMVGAVLDYFFILEGGRAYLQFTVNVQCSEI